MRPGISFWKGGTELFSFGYTKDKQEGGLTSAISISLRPKAAREMSIGRVNNS